MKRLSECTISKGLGMHGGLVGPPFMSCQHRCQESSSPFAEPFRPDAFVFTNALPSARWSSSIMQPLVMQSIQQRTHTLDPAAFRRCTTSMHTTYTPYLDLERATFGMCVCMRQDRRFAAMCPSQESSDRFCCTRQAHAITHPDIHPPGPHPAPRPLGLPHPLHSPWAPHAPPLWAPAGTAITKMVQHASNPTWVR